MALDVTCNRRRWVRNQSVFWFLWCCCNLLCIHFWFSLSALDQPAILVVCWKTKWIGLLTTEPSVKEHSCTFLFRTTIHRVWLTLQKKCFILICHVGKSTGLNNIINHGWTAFNCFTVRVLVLCTLAHCHAVMTHWDNTAIINVISNTCDFDTVTSQNVWCRKNGLLET